MITNHYSTVYAKTIDSETGKSCGISVFAHCLIVGIVAREYLKYLPRSIVERYSLVDFPLFASLHDIGKGSPGFQDMLNHFMGISGYSDLSAIGDQNCIKHEVVTAEHLKNKYSTSLIEMLRMHHGSLRSNDVLAISGLIGGKPLSYFGDGDWVEIRNGLHSELVNYFGDGKSFTDTWSSRKTSVGSAHWKYCAGFLCVCDFLGSNPDYFPPELFMEKELDDDLIAEHANRAIIESGLYYDHVHSGLSFSDIFGIDFKPRPLQENFASVVDRKGLYILEAPMGIGKTEAAYYAAYRCMERGLVRGVYFGLPTQTTSNSMFTRFKCFIESITDYSGNDVRLVHGNQALSGNSNSAMRSWFNGNKRGTLSSYGLGTLDQGLLSVLGGAKHFFIRTFGLSNKCVILDEIHSYDVYTSELIKSMIDDLIELDCVVIVLSATLTAESRSRLIGCYDELNQYPLITKAVDDNVSYHFSRVNMSDKRIKIRHHSVLSGESFIRSRQVIIDEVIDRVSGGELVLWIENTISDAQSVYDAFSGRFGVELGSLHSRFTNGDRELNEAYWVKLYGKGGDRLSGRILVSTQVCEQSIDIDADFMVSAMCPTDMLIQRIGRLHRHNFGERSAPECVILSHIGLGDFNSDLRGTHLVNQYMNVVQGGSYVYDLYILRQSYSVLKSLTEISIPSDIRILLEQTYADRDVSGIDVEFKRIHNDSVTTQTTDSMASMSRTSGVSNDEIGIGVDEGVVHGTRRIITRSHSVILCKECIGGQLVLNDGEVVTLSDNMPLEYRVAINANTVKVSEGIRNRADIVSLDIGNRNTEYLCLVLDSDGVSVNRTTGLSGTLRYDNKKGLYSLN